MTTNEKQNKQPEAGKKELTPRQIQMRKKMVVFPLFFLAFAGCMWLIFSPGEKEREEPSAGFNTELPTPESEGILSDKRDAYVQEEMRRREREKMRSLQDFAFGMEDEEEEPVMPAAVPDKSSGSVGGSSGAFRTSRAAYADINRQLGSFYEDTAGETGEEREMQAHRGTGTPPGRTAGAENGSGGAGGAAGEVLRDRRPLYEWRSGSEAPRQKTSVSGKASVQPVRQVRRNIVSLLAAPLPDSVFAREFVKPRNWGFNTVGSDLREPERNSIRAAVQQTVTLTDGGEVTFRLLEPMMAGDLLIPSGTPVTGTARINGERLTVKVSAVQHGGAVVPVDLSVYDTNGNEGIPVPGSEELNAVKEIAANMGAGMGSSITITDDAGSQLLSDLGRSAIQGVSQYVSKKMRSVKVTLKAGYSVLLLPPLQ
ncbi:conjugative transposon protein TraM [Bacteroides thetaiotaomicron]|uniref:conjugative transposon protein TraM n=1 Tax=Bacteroides thetaiotaomicron TaxID=818 RepID=UPI00216576BA|nr:conjugative transposon protein TraM [Bacteroides thetaiotaomicron]UVV81382.1 conjugative transposon protein TraM [Bacteroides thetaiotaomicron]